MATLREQLCEARRVAFFDTTLNPRAITGCVLNVGNPQSETTATVIVTERLGKSSRDDTTGVQSVENSGSICINKADVAELPEVNEGFRGTCTTPDGTLWHLGDIQYQDDAFFRVRALRTVITGAGKHRAMPRGG